MAKLSPQPGQMIDQFKVVSLLHRGGMSQLWQVKMKGEPEPLLMKIPIISEGEDPAAIVGFEMEQMIMPRLQGPHVPRFIASGEFAGQPYIVMEKVPGESLLPMLQKLPLPVEEVARIAARVADALAPSMPNMSSTSTSSPPTSCFDRLARRYSSTTVLPATANCRTC